MWNLIWTRAGVPTAVLTGQLKSVLSENPSNFRVFSRNFSVSKVKLLRKTDIHQSQTYSDARDKWKSNRSGSRIPPGGWFLLVIPVSTLVLGVWQVYRWRWKLGLIDEMRKKSIADPVPIPEDFSELENLDYMKVTARGEFDYSNEVLLGPRPLVRYDQHEKQNRGVFSSSSGNNGYHIITPFKLEGRSEVILVNRGWVSSRNIKLYNHISGPVEITAIIRKPEQRQPFVGKHRPGQTVLHYRDVPTMSQMLNTDEALVDLYSIEGVDFSNAREESIPVPRQTLVTLRNEHVSYFVTWFSLSAITSYMWHRRFIRRLNLL